MLYIVSTLLRKAIECPDLYEGVSSVDDLFKKLILMPQDYGYDALHNPETRKLMEKIELVYGGEEYDSKYPDGIPTSINVQTTKGENYDSGFVMYPNGHARNVECDLEGIL